jgi:hypothetical protein
MHNSIQAKHMFDFIANQDKLFAEMDSLAQEIIYEECYGRMTRRQMCSKLGVSRNKLDDFLDSPHVVEIKKCILKDNAQRLCEKLDFLDNAALETLSSVILLGKEDNRLKAALEHLKGRGRYKEHNESNQQLTIRFEAEFDQTPKEVKPAEPEAEGGTEPLTQPSS